MAKQANKTAAKQEAVKADSDKFALAKALMEHANRLAQSFAGSDAARKQYEQEKEIEAASRKDLILEAVSLLSAGKEGRPVMATPTPEQQAYIGYFQSCAWTESGRKGKPLLVASLAKEAGIEPWPTLNVYSGYLKSIFLAGNIAGQKGLTCGHRDGTQDKTPWDAWNSLQSVKSWQDLTAMATKIRLAAFNASYIDKKHAPKNRQTVGSKRKLSDKKKAELFGQVADNADNAQDGRRLIDAALAAFIAQGRADVRSEIIKATDAYLSTINRLLETGVTTQPAMVAQQLADAEAAVRKDVIEGRLQTVANMTAAAPGTGHEQRVQEAKLVGPNVEAVKRGSQRRALTAAEAMPNDMLAAHAAKASKPARKRVTRQAVAA